MFAPDKIRVPDPVELATVKDPVELMTPDSVTLFPLVSTVPAPDKVMFRPEVIPAPACNVPPEIVIAVPVSPSALSELIATVPAWSVKPPEKPALLSPVKLNVPTPLLVTDLLAPEIAPARVSVPLEFWVIAKLSDKTMSGLTV